MTTRTLSWTGGDTLSIDSSIDVENLQGPENTVVISGPKGLADRVKLENGRLSMGDGDERVVFGWSHGNFSARSERDELKVVVTTASVRRFEVNGSGDLRISAYDQPTMDMDISGSAEVAATGRTGLLRLDISGSGDADLRTLAAQDANVQVSGSGNADIAPTGEADVSISGSGDVTLDQATSGRIDQTKAPDERRWAGERKARRP
ncbi:hypothetical protein LTR94_030254, partial [Friedmanniomyces endolithicus]